MAKASNTKEKGTDIVPQKGGAVGDVIDYGADAGAGFEGHTREDYSMPFFHVLQSNSPQVENIDGAKAGMIINTATNELFDGKKGIEFIPATTQHVFVEWVPRDQGGGMVAVHELNSDVVKKARADNGFGRIKLDNGNELIETFYVFGSGVGANGVEQGVIAFTSTKIKKYKGWMNKARAIQIALPDGRKINPPIFAHKYLLKTVKEKNKKGEFWNLEIAFTGGDAAASRLKPTDELYLSSRALRDVVTQGKAKVDHSQGREAGESEPEDGEAPF